MDKNAIFLGAAVSDGGSSPLGLSLRYANRHGLIAGATGTGKTVTLQVLAEGFAAAGVPVFAADVKGDLAGLAVPGAASDKLLARAAAIGLDGYTPRGFSVRLWDLFGDAGYPLRATVSDMGPLLLSRLLGLNEVQDGVLTLAFRLADDEGLMLLDLKDLRALLVDIAERARALSIEYGQISRASVGAIQRRLLALEEQGGAAFFGEPALELDDLFDVDEERFGVINLLAAEKLMQAPKAYATFLLWLLSELFEQLPEVGDREKPRLVFFFDEAHLLFDNAPPALIEKIEQVARLIRSKGVGVFFVTQNPLDIPDTVSSQLANRIIHGLRAYTPREKRVVKAAAETFRANPAFDAAEAIGELGVGEALVSTLGDDGAPGVVERALIRPPASRMGTLTARERVAAEAAAPLLDHYRDAIDRESAYEILKERAARRAEPPAETTRTRRPRPPRRRQSVGEAALKSAARTFSSTLARELVRGLLGGLRRR